PGSDRQRAGGVGSRVVRIGQRGHNGVAAGVGGRRGRSIVSDRDGAQTGGAGRGGGGLRRCIVGLRQVAEGDCRCRLVDRQRAGGVGSRVVRIGQRGDNSIAADVRRRGCRSVVGDRNAAQTGRAGRDRGGLRRSIVGLRQVAERDRRRSVVDRQRAGGVGSGGVRIGQRGYNSVAADVRGRSGRSVVRDRNAAQTGRAGRGRGLLGRTIIGLRQVAERDRRRSLVDRQRAGGVCSGVVRIVQRGHNNVAPGVSGRGGRSVVSDRDAAQTGRAGRDGGGLRRSIVGLRQVAWCDRRRCFADDK